MCGYCCGGTPVEKRGEGHRGCSVDCYNAPRRTRTTAADPLRQAVEAVVADMLATRDPEAIVWADDLRRALDDTASP